MTYLDMRKMNRAGLLAALESATQKADNLESELAVANAKLNERNIAIRESGSLAEAVLRVQGIAQAIDDAAAQYLDNIKQQQHESREESEKLLEDTKTRCARMEEETRIRCEQMLAAAQEESQAYWDEVYQRIRRYTQTSDSLKSVAQSTMPEVVV